MAKKSTVPAMVTSGGITVPTNAKEVSVTIEELKAQLKLLKKPDSEKVSLDISYDDGEFIKSIEKVSELLEISASINARSEAYDKEIERYKLDKTKIVPFTTSGKTKEEWVKILDKAIYELLNKSKIQLIENAIKDLSEHVDAETKLANKLKEIVENSSKLIQ